MRQPAGRWGAWRVQMSGRSCQSTRSTAPWWWGTARRLLDGNGQQRGGSWRARDSTMAPRWWGTARRLLDGEGQRATAPSLIARDGANAAAMKWDHNGDGRWWTVWWWMDHGDGRCGATAMDGATETGRRGMARWWLDLDNDGWRGIVLYKM
jgi:hypothetical protein